MEGAFSDGPSCRWETDHVSSVPPSTCRAQITPPGSALIPNINPYPASVFTFIFSPKEEPSSFFFLSPLKLGLHGGSKLKMPKKKKCRDVDRPELHIIHYLSHPKYSLRMLTCDHPVPPGRYNERVEEYLRQTDFYHASQIGVVQCQKVLVNALIERWHPDTHTFHLLIGECAVTLEDVAIILGLPTDGLPVTGMTMSSFEALEADCLHQFEVAPSVHWKYLPLLRDFGSIGQYSWGSACLAHLYRALCRASRYDCKEIDGPLTLLLDWAWIRLPYLAPLPRESRSFPLANRWRNWEHGDRRYRYLTLAHFRKALDDLQEGQFVWVAYALDRVDPDIIPPDIYMHSVCWSATVSLVSFECIEWHATDRYRRQFDFVQGVPHQEQNLDKTHGEVLTGPKNLNWATATTHSFWYWYRAKFGDRLNLSNLMVQENDEGNQHMDVDSQEQEPQSPPPPPPHPNPLPQE
ncbi:uncharacterized protein DS421_14g454120 [Arachis hypogaea]|nr:uncharacterized protein DS421_14g454120 [Arachis hypogaea]